MANNHSSKRQATALRCGNIKATILQNAIENGPSFATPLSQLLLFPEDVTRVVQPLVSC